MLNAATADTAIPVREAQFSKDSNPDIFWTERVETIEDEITLTWHDCGDPLLLHTQPNELPGRRYGLCTVLVPALGARLTVNGENAAGKA